MEGSFLKTEYFSTCKEREEAFAAKVKGMIPARIFGPRRFWQDFNRLIANSMPPELPAIHIPADPRHCLAFSSPRQVLQAAAMAGNRAPQNHPDTVAQAASVFDLDKIMDRPIRCLSGGEAAKTALAKAWIAAGTGRPLVMASPSGWLSAANSGLLENVVRRFIKTGLSVTILAMEGENEFRPIHPRCQPAPGPVLNQETRGLEIELGLSINSLTGTRTFCRIDDISARLPSPCLISGDNGQGKSLLAKAMAGAVSTRGHMQLECAGKQGPARLIFQDVVSQALMRSCRQILTSGSRPLCQNAAAIFRQLVKGWQANFEDLESAPDHLARIKLALAAVRLASLPAVLILDEPDWGLSRKSATALVAAIIHQAHQMEIATILISHKPWWRRLVASRLAVNKRAAAADRTGRLFTIGLESTTCSADQEVKP